MVDNLPIGEMTREVVGIIAGQIGRYRLTQKALEPVFGADQSQISKILRGQRTITIDQVEAACWALELDFDDVMKQAWDVVVNYDPPAVPTLIRDRQRVEPPKLRVVGSTTDSGITDELRQPSGPEVRAEKKAAIRSSSRNSNASNNGGASGGS